ncbi:hypothetical protein [Nocardiopsis halophila]|uniref:hypothetical protein n=1 Tax=Nocardiopsis halophila TaxID=141692 RepID=UPI000349E733|nr:hypothetical protein [Nocardiopsis halophila]
MHANATMNPYIPLGATAEGLPVCWGPLAPEHTAHCLIAGTAGTGKSHLAACLAAAAAAGGGRVAALPGRSSLSAAHYLEQAGHAAPPTTLEQLQAEVEQRTADRAVGKPARELMVVLTDDADTWPLNGAEAAAFEHVARLGRGTGVAVVATVSATPTRCRMGAYRLPPRLREALTSGGTVLHLSAPGRTCDGLSVRGPDTIREA